MVAGVRDVEAELDLFVEAVRHRINNEPGLRMGSIHRSYVRHSCQVGFWCGETEGWVDWVEERGWSGQLLPQLDNAIVHLRRREATRVAEREILMGTVARFYVDEDA